MREDIFQLLEYGASLGLRMVLSTTAPSSAATRPEAPYRRRELCRHQSRRPGNSERCLSGNGGRLQKKPCGLPPLPGRRAEGGAPALPHRTTVRELSAIFVSWKRRESPGSASTTGVRRKGERAPGGGSRPEETRDALDFLIEKTLDFGSRGVDTEILTVDNHCDGLYVFLKMKERDPERAERIFSLLGRSGGNRSGMAIGAVDWEGNVTIDQFTRSIVLGNIREKGFENIWRGEGDSFLAMLRDRKPYLRGRCGACRRQEQCNGNLRARARAAGDFWGPDPAWDLTDGEIGL